MRTIVEKEFDKWVTKYAGVQDADIFQNGTLVREVVIKYAEYILQHPTKEVTDSDIENASRDYINERKHDGLLTEMKQRIKYAYSQGAKDMRDGNIYISPDGKIPASGKEQGKEERDVLIKFIQWIIKDSDKVTESDAWISADTVDAYLNSK